MDSSRRISLILSLTAIACFLLAGCAYLQAAASYTLSFSFCTAPGTANMATLRCRMPLLYGGAFWALLAGGTVLSVVAMVRGRRRLAAIR
ncbi:hypothetical protein FZ025_12555 [Xanthomonas hyacinthi]|uniref:Lipoprotein n=1 Tax=Xanthomonas hyacinthi TaxID=56455 RepID=A0A2S7ESM1_9XANT|nr:hypothetical protein [Xanthomonas hyacinthi]KLD73838.1 hypothetical protein Y886_35845 [Xanthomonas hyacinthi DSM 19077]PPU96128.1 hypothetical protein XhyaCFBP1156_16150 [Xanthomonas hyacinthi]QGY77422.1 hypothetical protein FZ025_12555 [Xanthomonas hyacinthi]